MPDPDIEKIIRHNFRRGGFCGSPWKQPVRRSLGLDGAVTLNKKK